MENWDDEDFEPTFAKAAPATSVANKWEGEDEEEDVKESWDDDENDKKEEKKKDEEVKKPKKKSLAERIAEKERLKMEAMAKQLKEEEDEITPEEQQRRQKESDLKLALETTFDGSKSNGSGESLGDLSLPETKEEFESFTDTIVKTLTSLSKSAEYPLFVENLSRALSASMPSADIRKVKNALDNLYLEKQKIEKGDKSKKNKGKGKARLKMEGDNQLNQLSAYVNDYDEFDDFM